MSPAYTNPAPALDTILNATRPVLLFFRDSLRGDCAYITRIAESLAKRRGATLDVFTVDDLPQDNLSDAFGVTYFPTLLIVRDGKVTGTHIGTADQQVIEKWVDATLASSHQGLTVDAFKSQSAEDFALHSRKAAARDLYLRTLAGRALFVTHALAHAVSGTIIALHAPLMTSSPTINVAVQAAAAGHVAYRAVEAGLDSRRTLPDLQAALRRPVSATRFLAESFAGAASACGLYLSLLTPEMPPALAPLSVILMAYSVTNGAMLHYGPNILNRLENPQPPKPAP